MDLKLKEQKSTSTLSGISMADEEDELDIIDVETDDTLDESQAEQKAILDAIRTKIDENENLGPELAAVKLLRKKTRRKGVITSKVVDVIYEIHIVNAKFMAKFNLILGIFCVIMSIIIYLISENLNDVTFDYTNCKMNETHCRHRIVKDIDSDCVCTIYFNITRPFLETTYIYYELYPFYQNNRRYVESVDVNQLLGNQLDNDTSCDEFAFRDGKNVAPCGAIANTIFNDTFRIDKMKYKNKSIQDENNWTETGLAFDDLVFPEFKLNFENPDPKDNLTAAFQNTVKPNNWPARIEERGGYLWEGLMAWIQISPLPTVVKMYARIKDEQFGNTLPAGFYRLAIDYNYPVWSVIASKSVKIANTAFLGHRNYKLAYYCFSVGVFLMFSAAVLYYVHLEYDKATKAKLLQFGIRTRIDSGFTFYRKVND